MNLRLPTMTPGRVGPLLCLPATLALAATAAPLLAQDTQPTKPQKPEAPAATTPAADLPPAEKIVEDAIKAMGGRKAFEAIESKRLKASMTAGMNGMSMDLEFFMSGDDKMLMRQSVPGMGEMELGINGEIGWMGSDMTGGYQLLEGEQLHQTKSQADMHGIVLSLADRFASLETAAREDYGGTDAYRVRLAPKNPDELEVSEQSAFFSVETGLILGITMVVAEGTRLSPVTMNFDQWKEFDKVKMFTTMSIIQGPMEIAMEFTEIEFNKVDPEIFNVPDEVKKQIESRKKSIPTTEPATTPETKPGDDG